MKENTDDGASLFKRNAEKVKQRKLKRAKRREDRRKYGVNKKRRAENKADAAAKVIENVKSEAFKAWVKNTPGIYLSTLFILRSTYISYIQ